MLNSKASSLRVHLLSADFKDFNIQNLKPMHFPNGVFCIDTPNIPAVLISNIINIPFAFNQLLMSANVYFLREGHFSLEAKILTEKGWSGWFNFGLFGTNRSESVSGQSNDFGIMDTDILKCHSYCTAIQYRLKIFANDKAFINAVSFVTTDTQKKYSEYGNDVLLPKTVINVAPISQMTQSSERAKDLCSPTAVTMALSCAGIKTDVLNTAARVHDNQADLYGNWFLNTAYAGTMGLYSILNRFNGYDEVYSFIQNNIPVIASLTFNENELTGAPISKTRGHLVLIKGFTENGDIIVNDPAVKSADDGEIVYNRKEFEKAWFINKLGTSYIIAKSLNNFFCINKTYEEVFSKPLAKDDNKIKFIETQLLYNERVILSGIDGDKALVRTVEQFQETDCGKHLHPYYEGWINARALRFCVPERLDYVVSQKKIQLPVFPYNLSIGTKLKQNIAGTKSLKNSTSTLSLRNEILKTAELFLDDKYYWGGRSCDGVDCSGLVSMAYRVNGFDIPRNAKGQLLSSKQIAPDLMQKGDLIFTSEPNIPQTITHVMMYIESDYIIEATADSGTVRKITVEKKLGSPLNNLKNAQKLSNNRYVFFGTILGK